MSGAAIQAGEALDTLSWKGHEAYRTHFLSLKPMNHEETFLRFLFCFLSVQLSWETNVLLYNQLKDYDWEKGPEPVKDMFIKAKAGFHNTRPYYICAFADAFKTHPGVFSKREEEDWRTFRRRLDKSVKGLSWAKLSFALELCYPETSELVCLDRHMLRDVFGEKRTRWGVRVSLSGYERYETAWVRECGKRNMMPAIARLLYWDRRKGFDDSLFWTEVFV